MNELRRCEGEQPVAGRLKPREVRRVQSVLDLQGAR